MSSTRGSDADSMNPQGAVANAQDSGIFSAVCSGDRERSIPYVTWARWDGAQLSFRHRLRCHQGCAAQARQATNASQHQHQRQRDPAGTVAGNCEMRITTVSCKLSGGLRGIAPRSKSL